MNQEHDFSLKSKISLYLERIGTSLITRVIRKNKKTDAVQSVFNVPYGKNKFDKFNQFDWHCPTEYASQRFFKKLPVLFYIHGGSWSAGDKGYYTKLCKEYSEALGIVVININYRLMPNVDFVETFKDVVKCIKFCLSKEMLLGIDKNQVFVGGDSAGAHLASLFSARVTSKTLNVKCHILGDILLYGVYDLTQLKELNFRTCKVLHNALVETKGEKVEQFFKDYSPITFVTPDFPASYVTAGRTDTLHVESLRFIKLLEDNNVEVVKNIFPKNRLDARHAFINIHLKARAQALTQSTLFMKRMIKQANKEEQK